MLFLFNPEKFKSQYKPCSQNELVQLKHSIKIAKLNMHVAGICNAVIGLYYILFMNVWYVPVVSIISIVFIAYTIFVSNKMISIINELMG